MMSGLGTRDGCVHTLTSNVKAHTAKQASFREAFGLGQLLHMLHTFPDEPDLQIGVGYSLPKPGSCYHNVLYRDY